MPPRKTRAAKAAAEPEPAVDASSADAQTSSDGAAVAVTADQEQTQQQEPLQVPEEAKGTAENGSVTAIGPTAEQGESAEAEKNTSSAEQEQQPQSEEDPEEAKKRARAAKFGIPYVAPTAAATSKTDNEAKKLDANGQASSKSATEAGDENVAAGQKRKASNRLEGETTATGLGISDEVLAKRREKFGVVEPLVQEPAKKKQATEAAAAAGGADGGKDGKVDASKPVKEVDPALAAKLAEDEAKRRKRMERFGLPTTTAAISSATTTEDASLNEIETGSGKAEGQVQGSNEAASTAVDKSA